MRNVNCKIPYYFKKGTDKISNRLFQLFGYVKQNDERINELKFYVKGFFPNKQQQQQPMI